MFKFGDKVNDIVKKTNQKTSIFGLKWFQNNLIKNEIRANWKLKGSLYEIYHELHVIRLTTYMPLLTRTLCIIFFISWKSGLSSGFSTQHCFISSRISSTPVISCVTVGRNGGNSPSFTLRIMSTATKTFD